MTDKKHLSSPIPINFRATSLLPLNKDIQILVSNKYLLFFICQRHNMTRHIKLARTTYICNYLLCRTWVIPPSPTHSINEVFIRFTLSGLLFFTSFLSDNDFRKAKIPSNEMVAFMINPPFKTESKDSAFPANLLIGFQL